MAATSGTLVRFITGPLPVHRHGVWRRLRIALQQMVCGLFGHHMVKHFEPERLSLRCLLCGKDTPGWTLEVAPAFRRRRPERVVPFTDRRAA